MAGNSESNKRGAQTKKEKYGADFHSRIGSMGAGLSTPGYFGHLKATDPEKFREVTSRGGKKSAAIKKAKAKRPVTAKQAFPVSTDTIPEGSPLPTQPQHGGPTGVSKG